MKKIIGGGIFYIYLFLTVGTIPIPRLHKQNFWILSTKFGISYNVRILLNVQKMILCNAPPAQGLSTVTTLGSSKNAKIANTDYYLIKFVLVFAAYCLRQDQQNRIDKLQTKMYNKLLKV